MENVVLLIGCLVAGFLLKRIPGFPAEAHKGLNAFIIYLSLPALTLLYIPKLTFGWELAYPIGMSWIVFVLGWVFFDRVGTWLGFDRASIGCMVLCCGLGNTSFVGFPLLREFYGEEAIQYAILCDQPGAFLVLGTLALVAIAYYEGEKVNISTVGKKVLQFPPFLAFLVSLMITPLGGMPVFTLPLLNSLGQTLTPLALVSIGLQLEPKQQKWPIPALGLGLTYKLILAPLLIFLLYVSLAGQSGLAIKVSLLEAAMAPMITASILAIDNNLNPKLASLLVGIGIPISLLTVYGWYVFLG